MTKTNSTQFSNFFRAVSYYDKALKGASLCLWIKTGSCCDPENKEGLSHLLEHVLFGTKKRLLRSDIYLSVIDRQLRIKAFTKAEHTAFIIESVDKLNLQRCIDFLWEIFSGKLLSNQALVEAKLDISQEIDDLSADPVKSLFEALNFICFPNQFHGRSITGTKETINNIKIDDLVNFQRQQYSPNNSLICVCGNIEHQQLLDSLEPKFSELSENNKSFLPLSYWVGGVKKIKSVDKETRLAVSLPFNAKIPEDYYYYWLLSFLLSKNTNYGISAALKKGRIKYNTLHIYPEFLSRISRMQIYLSTHHSNIQYVMETVMDGLCSFKNFKAESLLKDTISSEITSSLKLVKLMNDNIEHLAMAIAEYELFPSDIPFPHLKNNKQEKLDFILENFHKKNREAVIYSIGS